MAYNKKMIKKNIGKIVQQYKRKSSTSFPNDRNYDRKLEKIIRKMDPEELSEIMNDEE